MKKYICTVVTLVLCLLLIGGGWVWFTYLRGAGPALLQPPADIVDLIDESKSPAENNTDFPLQLSDGFSISIFAKNLPHARVMRFDSQGNLWVSQSGGEVSKLDVQDGVVVKQSVVFSNLNNPHGLDFDPQDSNTLYIAEEHRISRVKLGGEQKLEKIADLPNGGGHSTRTIGFGPDGRLYVTIGSSCNVCVEGDERRAKMYVMNKDGSDFKEYARGLRNAVFFTWHPTSGKLWATDMGRDLLGDDVPPDEVNIVEEGKNYGWPICYGQNIHDTQFDKNTYIRNPCMQPFEQPAAVDLQAHSAPLGLAFVPQGVWSDEYNHDLIVAYHGSWNRTTPTGYKLVRLMFDSSGAYQGTEDFITGWLTPSGALGRPVDVVIRPDGTMYVSDDKAGVIYLVQY